MDAKVTKALRQDIFRFWRKYFLIYHSKTTNK